MFLSWLATCFPCLAIAFMPPKKATATKAAPKAAKAKAKAKAKAVPQMPVKTEPAEQAPLDGVDPAEVKKMQSNLSTQGKANLKKLKEYKEGKLSLSPKELETLESKVQFYNEYGNLGRNQHHERMMMLASWNQDKSGKAWAQKTKTFETQTKTTEGTLAGFMTRFEIAQQENMDVDDKLLLAILNETPFDYDWDESSARERALKKQKEKRYHYGKRKHAETDSVTLETDAMHAGFDCNDKEKQNMGGNPTVTVVNPELVEFKGQLGILQSGKIKLEKIETQLKDLSARGAHAGVTGTTATEMDNALKELDTWLKDARLALATLDSIQAPSADNKAQVAEMIAEAVVHQDAAGKILKKAKAILS
ncbi:unnamed protein product [Symbiodinium sp. CCMP2592]|nr:unnamed protein product [Symbiodinium sp. CCMP2592]